MKLPAMLLTAALFAPVAAQEKGFTMGAQPRSNDRLIQHVSHGPQGMSIRFEQPNPTFGPKQPAPLIYGLSAVDLTPDRKNLMSYGALVPHQAFIGSHPWGNPAPGGGFPAFGFNQQAGPLMPFYGGGVGVVLGDGEPKLWGW